MQKCFVVLGLCFSVSLMAQNQPVTKVLQISDSIQVDTTSISPFDFKVVSLKDESIDSSWYQVSFRKAVIYPKDSLKKKFKKIKVTYYPLPKFLTQNYSLYDPKIILNSRQNKDSYFDLVKEQDKDFSSPFKGLNTSGNISRAVVVGNNQNAVTQSELDLQISGQISPKVSLRASIQDANVPTQDNGFSQRLDEFDQIFIELQGPNWGIRAGDIDLIEDQSFFARFTKRVQGLKVDAQFGENQQTQAGIAGALVRGVFARNQLTAQEGNQGPYKIRGPNGELFVLIVSGSEAVFVNGRRLQRGENYDYVINYNAGEIIFNPTFPITSEMRIIVEYQFTEQNFTRVVAQAKSSHQRKNWGINGMYFTESDLKNQPLQQSLNASQVQALAEAGDDQAQMFVPSAQETEFSENRILYKKEIINGIEAFVFSNDPEETLFSVTFTEVGQNQGNYILNNDNAVTSIYEFVPPENGVPQGNFAPIQQLIAPQQLQIATVNGFYNLSNKTKIDYEIALSENDQNLFSDLDDNNNSGLAARMNITQNLIQTQDSLNLDVGLDVNFIEDNFMSIERLFNVEFTRDWNIENPLGNQLLTDAYTKLNWKDKIFSTYRFNHLEFSENFKGDKHQLQTLIDWKPIQFQLNTSVLNSDSDQFESEFIRLNARSTYSFNKYWIGASIDLEDNQELNRQTDSLTAKSQRFTDYESFVGVGDSTAVYAQIGYRYRQTDSLSQGILDRASTSNDVYLKSTLVQNKSTQLRFFGNFRKIKFNRPNTSDRENVNIRLQYNQFLFDKKLNLRTTYETNSGSIARQDFTFVQVEPGQGQYTWIDYNENGIQELNEFELAQFQDQGEYVRILLPNQIFVGVNQNRFSEQLTLNLRSWESEEGIKKVLSHFFNQSAYSIDRKLARDGNAIQINPFSADGAEELALFSNFRNTIFFNRGRQHYTNSYTFISNTNKNLLSTGLQENRLTNHQWDLLHKFGESWLLNTNLIFSENESISENFDNRNFKLQSEEAQLKISYLFSDQKRFDAFYEYKTQDNVSGDEALSQQALGTSFTFIKGSRYNINGEFKYIKNDFEGNSFSPVAFQMLEGLQPEDNFTWTIFFQRKITSFLDLNLNYSGRKSSDTQAIHTGSVQLRAYF
ncbi:hypothetical protein [Mesohalobacter halotolerans]|uniref:Uncharacterized protein n=1 Tax=Mesohalobacter halotolerans TaxID=1883405 RepID=A0A4U5TRG8_9FLAO|nr:hypothetical protein [Mesohalobacter halotolerans]MBS3738312.1 hypothetical protein [Psychroflexus sp.]TKS56849.1 hypothetical protein FCN74_00025 [Mesohalobacter halotolerans]